MPFRAISRPDDPQWRTTRGNPAGPEALARFINPNKGLVTGASDGHSIPVEGLGIASGQTFVKGALVRKDGSGDATALTEATQTVYGVALERVVSGATLGVKTDIVVVARVQFTDTQRTNKTVKPWFAVADVNGTTPSTGDVGTKCAITVTTSTTGSIWGDDVWASDVWENGVWAGSSSSSSGWAIDISDTGNQDVEVVDILPNRGEFVVRFLDAVIQS